MLIYLEDAPEPKQIAHDLIQYASKKADKVVDRPPTQMHRRGIQGRRFQAARHGCYRIAGGDRFYPVALIFEGQHGAFTKYLAESVAEQEEIYQHVLELIEQLEPVVPGEIYVHPRQVRP